MLAPASEAAKGAVRHESFLLPPANTAADGLFYPSTPWLAWLAELYYHQMMLGSCCGSRLTLFLSCIIAGKMHSLAFIL